MIDLPDLPGALCAQTDPELFYPDKGGSTREAKALCRACPVRAECLAAALDYGDRFGIWGGLSERERRKLKVPTGPRVCALSGCEETFPARGHKRYCSDRCRNKAGEQRRPRRIGREDHDAA